MPAPGIASVAGGNVTGSRFVRLNGADNTFVQCVAGEKVDGVSAPGTRNPPYSTLDDGFLAVAGEPFRVHGPTEPCLLECGAAVNAGDRLKADASGRGIPVSADGDQYGAVALQDGSGAGAKVLVRVEIGQKASV